MALDWNATYPGRVVADPANYPLGRAKDVTVPLDGTGTPWQQELIKDQSALFQRLIVDGIGVGNESGVADTVVASDYFDSLLLVINSVAGGRRSGLHVTRDSVSLMTTALGSIANQAGTRTLILPASIQKDITAAWVVGAGGGRPTALPLATGWWRRFIVGKPDGTTDLCWDTSVTAANFFADATAIAAGYTDATLYRRYGWVYVDAGLALQDFINSVQDPDRYYWNALSAGLQQVAVPPSGARAALTFLSAVPPDCFGDFSLSFANAGSADSVLLTTAAQADVAVTSTNATIRLAVAGAHDMIKDRFEVDVNQQLFARSTMGAGNLLSMRTHGWRDTLVVP